MKRGTVIRAANLDKKSSANFWYMMMLVKIDGKLETLIFTEKEVERARERTRKNPEDEVVPTFIDKLLRILGKTPAPELPDGHSEK